jgi:transaldolase
MGSVMKHNPLRSLNLLGQSIWLDYIRRDLVTTGELGRLIEGDALRGMTSNPAIFERAISHSADYAEEIRTMRRGQSKRAAVCGAPSTGRMS